MRLEFEIRDGVSVLRLKGRFVRGDDAVVDPAARVAAQPGAVGGDCEHDRFCIGHKRRWTFAT